MNIALTTGAKSADSDAAAKNTVVLYVQMHLQIISHHLSRQRTIAILPGSFYAGHGAKSLKNTGPVSFIKWTVQQTLVNLPKQEKRTLAPPFNHMVNIHGTTHYFANATHSSESICTLIGTRHISALGKKRDCHAVMRQTEYREYSV